MSFGSGIVASNPSAEGRGVRICPSEIEKLACQAEKEHIFVVDEYPYTATCDKAGSPNDVCPYGQVMSASPNDVALGCDVVPTAQWANITSLATFGSNIITNEVSNITFA